MPRILSVVGARPQFVKAAAVSHVLRSTPGFSETLVHTGQHYDDALSEVFFRELGIPTPDLNLGIGSASHGVQTGRMLEALEAAMQAQQPDAVLLYGDTNSTLAGALAAAKLQIPIAHVEAGLRSFNRAMPEETNRLVSDHLSRRLFAPTEQAMANLAREGLADRAVRTGDVMYDAMVRYAERAAQRSRVLAQERLEPRRYVLATIHRAENTDVAGRLLGIFDGLAEVSRDLRVFIPMHPRTRNLLAQSRFTPPPTLTLAEPVGYLDMIELERNARLVVTDSGGVQKEAYFHRVPCVTLRTETEWVELVDAGWNQLVSPHSAREVAGGVQGALRRVPPEWQPIYGDGHAAVEIVSVLHEMV